MAKPTRMVIYFDDGTSIDVPLQGMSSVFMNEAAAIKCGHRPPYQPGPPPGAGSGNAGGGGTVTTMEGGSCYYMNGVIICP